MDKTLNETLRELIAKETQQAVEEAMNVQNTNLKQADIERLLDNHFRKIEALLAQSSQKLEKTPETRKMVAQNITEDFFANLKQAFVQLQEDSEKRLKQGINLFKYKVNQKITDAKLSVKNAINQRVLNLNQHIKKFANLIDQKFALEIKPEVLLLNAPLNVVEASARMKLERQQAFEAFIQNDSEQPETSVFEEMFVKTDENYHQELAQKYDFSNPDDVKRAEIEIVEKIKEVDAAYDERMANEIEEDMLYEAQQDIGIVEVTAQKKREENSPKASVKSESQSKPKTLADKIGLAKERQQAKLDNNPVENQAQQKKRGR